MPKTSWVDPCKVKCLKVFHLPPPLAAPILSGDLAFCCNPQKYSGSLRESHLKRQLNGESADIGSTWPRIESFTVHHALASSMCLHYVFILLWLYNSRLLRYPFPHKTKPLTLQSNHRGIHTRVVLLLYLPWSVMPQWAPGPPHSARYSHDYIYRFLPQQK